MRRIPSLRSLSNLSVVMVSALVTGALGQPSLIVTPGAGQLGSVIQLEVSPQTPGFELDEATTRVGWLGQYFDSGGASQIFAVLFDADEVQVTSPWTAEVVLGEGTFANAPDLLSLVDGGSLVGTITVETPVSCPGDFEPDGILDFLDVLAFLTAFGNQDPIADLVAPFGVFDFGDVIEFLVRFGAGCPPSPVTLTNSNYTLSPATDAAKWRTIYYPTGPGGLDPPELGMEPDELVLYRLSILPNPSTPTVNQLTAATGAHYVVTVLVEDNATAQSAAPLTITVDVVSVDGSQVETDRLVGLTLTKLAVDDEPSHIVYSSDIDTPILVVDTALNQSMYSGFSLLLATTDGMVHVIPNIP